MREPGAPNRGYRPVTGYFSQQRPLPCRTFGNPATKCWSSLHGGGKATTATYTPAARLFADQRVDLFFYRSSAGVGAFCLILKTIYSIQVMLDDLAAVIATTAAARPEFLLPVIPGALFSQQSAPSPCQRINHYRCCTHCEPGGLKWKDHQNICLPGQGISLHHAIQLNDAAYLDQFIPEHPTTGNIGLQAGLLSDS